jgi:hypothetical protein
MLHTEGTFTTLRNGSLAKIKTTEKLVDMGGLPLQREKSDSNLVFCPFIRIFARSMK